MVTKFEESFPLKKMTIEDYERRVKKLVNPDSADSINEAQIVESFKDVFPDLKTEGTLIR